jgi:hypothetical protein
MTLHLVKLAVGADSIEDIETWQRTRRVRASGSGAECCFHRTFQTPKRTEELLDGGSIFWVVGGTILARQKLVAIEAGKKDDGSACCLLLFSPKLIAVRPTPRRAFQGWRYLDGDDAPGDLKGGRKGGVAHMPAQMRRKLADLGLL